MAANVPQVEVPAVFTVSASPSPTPPLPSHTCWILFPLVTVAPMARDGVPLAVLLFTEPLMSATTVYGAATLGTRLSPWVQVCATTVLT